MGVSTPSGRGRAHPLRCSSEARRMRTKGLNFELGDIAEAKVCASPRPTLISATSEATYSLADESYGARRSVRTGKDVRWRGLKGDVLTSGVQDLDWTRQYMAIDEWPEPVADHPTPGMHIWGWMSPDQVNWLSEQAAQMQSVVEVQMSSLSELGSHQGMFACSCRPGARCRHGASRRRPRIRGSCRGHRGLVAQDAEAAVWSRLGAPGLPGGGESGR
jgi:hypothetical protein